MSLNAKKNRRLVTYLLLLVVGMFGFGFALVPLYNVFCKVTGLNGKTNQTAIYNNGGVVDKSRTVIVQFLATNNANLPWEFYPLVTTIKVHPGENTRIAYYAKNNSSQTMTVQAIPSVTPGAAAAHLKKTECFCFTQQTFKAGEARNMPVLFHVDTELPKDIHEIALSYTMFDAGKYIKK
jgi:cytochrome c oxidase assembly protein subunit 11